MYFILSLLLGMFPETLFLTMFLIYTKNIKEKRLKLLILINLSYILCIMLIRFETLFYIIYSVLTYISLKILYKEKTQIIDIFIIILCFIYIFLNSMLCYWIVNYINDSYYILLVINRILLIIPFIFKNKFNVLYKRYCKLWNRNDKEKRPIKSITLRNISLIALNIFIFLCNIVCLYILKLKG